jgi:AraC-like DNA-binding protein
VGLFYRNQPFAFGETEYLNGGAFGPLRSSFVNLVIVAKGCMEAHWDGRSAEIPAGCTSLIYNHEAIEFRFPIGTGTLVYWCETGDPAGSSVVRQMLKKAPITLETSPTLKALMDIGRKLSRENRDEVRAFRDALGEALICAYLHQANLDREEAIVPEPVSQGKEFIEAHFCEPLESRSIARRVGISPQYLASLYRRSYGMSPIQHLWSLRAEKGAFLLRQSGLTVSEVAFQCGYKNPFHFSRHIKETFGHSPTKLRSLKRTLQPSVLKGEFPDVHHAS